MTTTTMANEMTTTTTKSKSKIKKLEMTKDKQVKKREIQEMTLAMQERMA